MWSVSGMGKTRCVVTWESSVSTEVPSLAGGSRGSQAYRTTREDDRPPPTGPSRSGWS